MKAQFPKLWRDFPAVLGFLRVSSAVQQLISPFISLSVCVISAISQTVMGTEPRIIPNKYKDKLG